VPSPAPPARPTPEDHRAGPGLRDRDRCVGVSGEAFGEAFRFERGSDTFAPGERERLRMFAGTIVSSDVLAVHGFASEEGPRDLNERLSCQRAHAGLTVLTQGGASPAQIRRPLFMHGAMPGPRPQRRSVVIGRETRPPLPAVERLPAPTPPVGPQATPAPSPQAPELGIKRDFAMTPEQPVFNLGPFLTTWQAKLWLEGGLRCGDPTTKVSFSLSSEAKADFEAKLGGALKSFKVKGTLVPGGVSKIGIQWGEKGAMFGHDVTVEVAAIVAPAPFQTTVKVTAIQYDSLEHWPHVQYGGCRIVGKADIGAEIKFYPNPAWWAAVGTGTAGAVRAGAAAARGLFVAEAGGLTAVGAGTVAGAAAAVYIAWVGYGFYQLTRAHRAGREQSIAYAFAGGYASALTELADLDVVSGSMRRQLPGLLDLDWQATFNEAAALYVNEQAYTIPSIERAGRAAIAQEVDRYIKEHGVEAWKALSARLRQRYGPSPLLRRARFFQVMQGQVVRNAPIGIELR
jgi:hypothetical protein